MGAVELPREQLQVGERPVVIVKLPCPAQPALHRRAVAFGQVVEHVALLVTVMPTSA